MMMSDECFFLRQNIQVEPLIDHWYAWPHLIPPATAARNITERHLKIMDSYISNLQIHAQAVKNPNSLWCKPLKLDELRMGLAKTKFPA
jgi:hypothetical protein